MTREQMLAYVNAMCDLEEVKADAVARKRMADFRHYQEVKQAQRAFEDASDMQNFVCDMAGVRRVNPSFHKISNADYRPLDVVYADNHGETYNDGISNSILGRAISGVANAAGLGRVFLDNYHRI